MEDGETQIVPKGLGEKLSQSAWKELTEAGWHNLTCLEVLHGNCPYASGSAEWAVCRVTSNFLLSTLGELNAGKEKPVMKVRGLLVPYLGGPGAKIPDDEEHEATLEQRLDALWQQVDNATATTYVALDLDSSALANALLNDLKQDGVGNLQAAKDQSGKPVRPGLTMQQILFTILGANNWKSRFAVSGGGWSIYAWHLAIGLAIALLAILMVGVALWRAGSPKARVPD